MKTAASKRKTTVRRVVFFQPQKLVLFEKVKVKAGKLTFKATVGEQTAQNAKVLANLRLHLMGIKV